jgi:hypothetical protein
MNVDTVYWEDDPTRTREVKGICVTCQRRMYREYGIYLRPNSVVLVSPSGLGHADDHEMTLCGKDATGPDWWWRS